MSDVVHRPLTKIVRLKTVGIFWHVNLCNSSQTAVENTCLFAKRLAGDGYSIWE